MESRIVLKTQRANVIVALVVGVTLGTAGTLLLKSRFSPSNARDATHIRANRALVGASTLMA